MSQSSDTAVFDVREVVSKLVTQEVLHHVLLGGVHQALVDANRKIDAIEVSKALFVVDRYDDDRPRPVSGGMESRSRDSYTELHSLTWEVGHNRDKADARSPAERTRVREQAPQHPTQYRALIHFPGETVSLHRIALV